MSEQKMREALELAVLTMQRNVMKDCNHGQTSGLYAAIFKCQEAIAAPAGEQVGLTDAEIDAEAVRLGLVDSYGWCAFRSDADIRGVVRMVVRAAIAAQEAKRASCSQTAKKSTHETGRVDETGKIERVGGAS